MTEATQIGTVMAKVLTDAAGSPRPSMTGSPTSTRNLPEYEAQLEHKRAFLAMFQRWERIFKRKDGEPNAEKWLIAEYYDSLGHLSPMGLETLTKLLKARCTFFPTIAECLAAMKPADRYDYAHPFLGVHRGGVSPLLAHSLRAPAAHLPAPVAQLGSEQ